MARYTCKCGETMSNTLAPNDIQYRIYSDKEWDDIINIGEMDSIDLPFPSVDVWRCPKCERLYVFNEEGRVIKQYVLEEQGTEG